MSTGTKKEKSPSQSKGLNDVKEARLPEPPAWLLEEYKWMQKLANEAENERGQTDTYWHTSLERVKTALRDEYGMEV